MWETCLLLFENRLDPYHHDGHVRRLGSAPGAWDDRAEALGVSDARTCSRRRRQRLEVRAAETLQQAASALVHSASGDLQRLAAAAAGPAPASITTPMSSLSSSSNEPLGSPGAMGPGSSAGRAMAGGGDGTASASASGGGSGSGPSSAGTSSVAKSQSAVSSGPWARLPWSLSRQMEAVVLQVRDWRGIERMALALVHKAA